MKLHTYLIAFCCIVLAFQIKAQDMDSELTKLSEDLAAKIQTNGCKKVTVLDFTDLQGNSSELGRYIAEQLAVNLVLQKRQFSVLDRANLKSILAEHKLTATGLVDPENAKKLGKFAGVDALVIGNITPIGSKITSTVKVITTETAEIVCAAKARFQADESTEKLLSQSVSETDYASKQEVKTPDSYSIQLSNILVKVEKFNVVNGNQFSISIQLKNTSTKSKVAIALAASPTRSGMIDTTLVAGDGSELRAGENDARGMRVTLSDPNLLTILDPGRGADLTIKYSCFGWSQPDLSRMKSATIYLSFIVNFNFRADDYDNYQPRYGMQVPKTQTANLSLKITDL